MSWFSRRVAARVRALLPEDWFGSPGQRFRQTVGALPTLGETPQAGGRSKRVQREPLNREYDEALTSFAVDEDGKIAAEIEERSIHSSDRLSDLDARLKQIAILEREAALHKTLKAEGLTLYRDEKGNLTLLKAVSGQRASDRRRLPRSAPRGTED